MVKFKKLYLLNELFSSWQYKVPKDKEKQLYDFYMLTGLPEPTDINLSTALEDARDTITSVLKPELLKALVFAVSAKIRHILDNNTINKLKGFFKQNNAEKFLKAYITWQDGTWENGDWENGDWENGDWENGDWENGDWENGDWENGDWEKRKNMGSKFNLT